MNSRIRRNAIALVLAAICTFFGSPVSAEVPPEIQATFETYCFGCHDNSTRAASLSLESLDDNFQLPSAMAAGTRIYDKLVAREMPPPAEAQPTADERKALLDWLRRELHHSSLAYQQREGRAGLRRMNRTEYENTLRDLFGVTVVWRDFLPEDTTTAGFDNVGAGLGVSAAHLVRYQRAADRAIAAALEQHPGSRTERTTGRQRWERWFPVDRDDIRQSSDLHLRYSARLDGDTFVIHQQTDSNGFLEFECGEPIRPGRYRVRASVSARNSGGRPLPVLIFRVGLPRERNVNNARVIAMRDAPAGQPTVIEEEFTVTDDPTVSLGKRIALKGWTLPEQKHPDDLRKDIAAGKEPDFSGPALAIDWVELEGPLENRSSYRLLFGDLPRDEEGEPQSATPEADADRLLRGFLPHAFRRPVDDATAEIFVQFARERLDRGDRFADAMKAAYRYVLCSPHFLLLLEKPGPLDDYSLASRLSYFLWSSGPDDVLLTRAANGELRKPEILRNEVERMLSDPRAGRFTENFTGQWLDLRKLHMTKPDVRYVEFDDILLWSMPLETTRFFDEILTQNRSVTEFVMSDWTFLNHRLAQHYGVPGVDSWEMRRTQLPPSVHRGGAITHASILKVTANGTTTSPVLRGKWLLERILGKPPSPPPPDIPALEPDIRGATTVRQQLDKHRNLAACATCHVRIDPPGFALETYDVIGGWRDWYRATQDGEGAQHRVELANYPGRHVWRGPDVEKGFSTADGRTFRDIDDYRLILLEDPEQLARNIATKLLIYATGTDIQFADREVIEHILHETRDENFGLRSLLHAVVQSRCFTSK